SPWAQAGRPSTRRPVQLPFTALEDATGRRRKGGIGPRVDLGAHLVHRLGDRLGVVPGEILGHGVAEECTARSLQPACETLGIPVLATWLGCRRGCLRPPAGTWAA